MKYSEKWGDSVDIAVELALADLKLTRDQVDITILEEPSRGFFGIGSKLAKVRVEEKAAEAPAAKAEPPKESKTDRPALSEKSEKPAAFTKPDRTEKAERKIEITKEGKQEILIEVCGLDTPDNQPRPQYRFEREKKERGGRREPARKSEPKAELRRSERSERPTAVRRVMDERPADLQEQDQHPACIFLKEVSQKMGLDVSVKVFTNGETVYADIEGPDSGTIIGKRGQTLDAIQYLTSLVVNKDKEGYTRVVIDAEGYRQKREQTLDKLANRLADKVCRSSRSIRLEPMNPYERKIIHTALQDRAGVTTRSEGEEPYRRVVIEPDK